MQIAAKACRQALYSSSQAVARRGGGASAVASPAAANANARTNSLLVFRGRAPIARPQQQQQRQQQRAFSGGATGGPMPTPKYRAPIVVQPSGGASAHSATFIMLHGLGDSGDGWAAIADEFSPELPHVRMIFPHAPLRPITINMGMMMPGWYDLNSLDAIDQREDAAGLAESLRYVESLVAAEAEAGVPSDRVVVGGFSQGGAVALMALRSARKLAGVVGLSTYLPLRGEDGAVSAANAATPVLQAHGDCDEVVRYSYGASSHAALKALGVPAEFLIVQGMGHSAAPGELRAVCDFVKRVAPPL